MPAAIAPVITSALAATPVISAVGIGGVVTISNVIASTAFAVGASFASQTLSKTLSDKAPTQFGGNIGAVNSPEVRGSVKQATPPLRIVFGETRVGGAFYFYKVVPPHLYIGLMHSFMPISSYNRLFIGENEVLLSASDEPLNAPYLDSGGTARLSVATQSGDSVSQSTNSILNSIFGSGGTGDIDSDFRLPGIANSVFEFDYGADFDQFEALWGNVQIPDAQWVVKGTPVPDPRNPTHTLDFDPRDMDELYNAIATWDYSNNAALIQAFWAMMPFGLNAGPNNIRWDTVADAADFDDQSVPLDTALSDGTTHLKRHTIDGVVTLDQKPLTVMEAMLTANRGFIVPRAGKVTVSSSQPRTAVLTITDDDILGGFSYRDNKPKRDMANVVNGTFVAPDRQYQDAKAPERRRSDLVSSDGEELVQNLRLPFTARHQRAQRIFKAHLEETRLGKQIVGAFSLRCLGATEGQVIQFYSEIFPEMNGLYSVEEWGLSDDLSGVALSLAEYGPDIARDWNASEDEQTFSLEVEDI